MENGESELKRTISYLLNTDEEIKKETEEKIEVKPKRYRKKSRIEKKIEPEEENLIFFIEKANGSILQDPNTTLSNNTNTAPSIPSGKKDETHVKKNRPKLIRGSVCDHCNRTETVRWRKGPKGRGTLCNACGLQYGKATRRLRRESGAHSAISLTKILN